MFVTLLRSRTAWVIASVTVITALFLYLLPDDYQNGLNFIDLVAVIIVIMFVFALKSFLRSDVPLILLLLGFAGEYAFMDLSILPEIKVEFYDNCELHSFNSSEGFWYWAVIWRHLAGQAGCANSAMPGWFGKLLSYIVGVGVPEDTAKLVPVAALLLLAWGLRKLPESVISNAITSKIIAWSTLDRASSVVMIAFAGAVGFVLFESARRVSPKQIGRVGPPVAVLVKVIPGYPTSRFRSIGNGDQLTKDQWLSVGGHIASMYASMKGLMLTISRTIGLLTGHGAYAGIPAYYLALARRQPVAIGVVLVIFGVAVSSTLHGAWDTYTSATTNAPLAMLAAVVLLAVCVQTMVLEERAGVSSQAAAYGRSIVLERKIPDFPTGRTASPVKVPSAPRPMSAKPVGALIIEGSAISSGRRVPLQRDGGRLELAPDVACEVRVHPTDPNRLGLKNLTTRPWTLTMPDGRSVDVLPEKSAVLSSNAVIDFGTLRARIEMA